VGLAEGRTFFCVTSGVLAARKHTMRPRMLDEQSTFLRNLVPDDQPVLLNIDLLDKYNFT
jgi:hypothetical protein